MTEREREQLHCDVLIFVATSSEVDQLENVATEMSISFEKRKVDNSIRFFDLGTVGATRVNAVRTEMGPFSHGGSAAKGIYYKTVTGATAIIQLGMAFGINAQQQNIGDVLVSTHLFPYDKRKAETRNEWYSVDYSAVEPHPSKASLLEMCRQQYELQTVDYRVFFGGLLTGGARIFSRHFLDEMRDTIPQVEDGMIVGGEMEGAGLLSITPKNEPCWIVVKGICDFADENRDRVIEETRPIACRNSASFVLSALAGTPPN